MKDMRANRTIGTAPLSPDMLPSPPARKAPAEDTTRPGIAGDGQDFRAVRSKALTGTLSFADPSHDTLNRGAENLAAAVLESGDRSLIDKVKLKLGHASDSDLRAIARGTPLTEAQKDSLDPQEREMLGNAATEQGCQAVVEALKARGDSG